MPRPTKARSLIGACSVEETNVSDEQIDYSRPWKPRMDQCEEATLLFGQARLPLPPTRPTNRVIIYLFIPVTFTGTRIYASGYASFPISGNSGCIECLLFERSCHRAQAVARLTIWMSEC